MEKNKLNIWKRLKPEMIKVILHEQTEAQKRMRESEDSLTDRIAYEESRKFFNEGGPKMKRTIHAHVETESGKIPFTAHYPVDQEKNRLIIFIHGGGFVVGSPGTHDGIMRRLAEETGSVVMGIDYSLAPEVKFPMQILECVSMIEHVRQNEGLYGIDRDNITLAGDSAGAYLSLATAVYLRDKEKDIPYLKSLLLYYGSFGLADSMSMRLYGGEYDGLSFEALNLYSQLFTREQDRNNPYRNLFNSDLTHGIPPCYILSCTLDPLADDSRLLYEIMKEHRMDACYHEVDGVLHGFLHYSRMMDESMEAIKRSALFYHKYAK